MMKNALIAGVAEGMGKAIAIAMAKEGTFEKNSWLFLRGVKLLPRSQRRSLKGGDIHRSLKGNGRFLSWNVLFKPVCT